MQTSILGEGLGGSMWFFWGHCCDCRQQELKETSITCFLRPLQDAHQADFLLGLMLEGSSTYKTCDTSKVNFLKQSWTKVWYFLNYDWYSEISPPTIPPPNIEKPVPFPNIFFFWWGDVLFSFAPMFFLRHSCLVLEAVYNMLRSLLKQIPCFRKHRDQRDPRSSGSSDLCWPGGTWDK